MAKLFMSSRFHVTLDGAILTKERYSTGLTQSRFAALCGWSQQFQSQLESPELHEIHMDQASVIKTVIDNHLPS